MSEIDDLVRECESLRAAIAEANRRISEQAERITELYLAQKSRFLSAKSTEYDIGELRARAERAEREREEALHWDIYRDRLISE